jgi:glucose-6-phosphate isomerase
MGLGIHLNTTEDRAVMHVALRAPVTKQITVDGVEVVAEVHKVLDKIESFSNMIRNKQLVGCTGKALCNVVSIGIGGSYLGPEFVYEALRTDNEASQAAFGRTLRFLANVDPVDVARALHGLDPEETLVVVVSKTFTTAETMLNAQTVRKWLVDNIRGVDAVDIIQKHIVAVR